MGRNHQPFSFQNHFHETLQAPPTFPLLNNHRESYLRLNGVLLLSENVRADIAATHCLSDDDHHDLAEGHMV